MLYIIIAREQYKILFGGKVYFMSHAWMAPLLQWLVVLSRVLSLPAPLLLQLPSHAHLAYLLLLLFVLSCVLAPLDRLLQCLVSRCWPIAHVLAQLGLCMCCVFAQCWMIAPTSSLQDQHAFALAEEPWFVSLLV